MSGDWDSPKCQFTPEAIELLIEEAEKCYQHMEDDDVGYFYWAMLHVIKQDHQKPKTIYFESVNDNYYIKLA